jgi:DNA processing protein
MQKTPQDTLSEREMLDRLRLARTENIGPVTFRQLVSRYGSASEAITVLPRLAARGGRRRPLSICTVDAAEHELETLHRLGGELLVQGDPDFPAPLAAIDTAPVALSLLGDRSHLRSDAIGVVGARNASTNGQSFARRLAADLTAGGLTVVSGMARGIDAAAHAGALEGGTVAVLAGGVDVAYPLENEGLYQEIAARGLLLTEMPCGTQPRARHFPRRNRIIAGLSLGVVVIEAALRSGSLITARLANEQGREVFAVPGSPLDPRSQGTNNLIRNGATLTESAEDVLAELAAMRGSRLAEPRRPKFDIAANATAEIGDAAAAHERILGVLGPTAQPVDEIIRATGYSAATVWAALLDLELAGRLERQPGNLVALLAD